MVLNSFEDYKSDYFVIAEYIVDVQGFIQIVDHNNEGVIGASISINGNQPIEVTNAEGKIYDDELKGRNIKNVEIFWIGLSRGYYQIKNEETNCLIIKIIDKNYDTDYFSNEQIKVRKNFIKLRRRKYIKH